jgi:non-heme chloroperoxidase
LKRFLFAICLLASSFSVATVQGVSAQFRTSDGVSLHYYEAGNGPVLVLIPGWTMPADIFEPQINELSHKFHVVALDPRSQGDSEKTAEGNYLERHALDIQELMDHLQIREATLLGWSNGVPDVLTFVDKQGTSKIRGVILVDGFLNASDPQMQRSMNGMLQMLQADRVKFTDAFVRSMYATKQPELYIKHVEEQALKTPTNTAVTEMYNVVAKGDFTPIVQKLDRPVLYICEPPLEAQGKLLQQILPAGRVEVFKDSGHAIFVDQAEKFNKVVSDFIASLPPMPKDVPAKPKAQPERLPPPQEPPKR